MVKSSPHTPWKGCPLCNPHKHKGNGDPVRSPWQLNRKMGRTRRWNRHDLPREEQE